MDWIFDCRKKTNRTPIKSAIIPTHQFDIKAARKRIDALLVEHGIFTSIIWSRDEAVHCGLLDILPQRANKLQAIRFLMEEEKIPETTTAFAGDSGNDLDALTSGLQAILVKNSADDVQKTARKELEEKGLTGCLYIARGDLHGLNGNYAAGVLEGLSISFRKLKNGCFMRIKGYLTLTEAVDSLGKAARNLNRSPGLQGDDISTHTL